MRDFLSEYITTLTDRQRKSVFSILATAQLEKEDLDAIADKLANIKKNAPIAIPDESYNGKISAGKLDGVYRDTYIRLSDLFSTSNSVSLLLDSYNKILISEIKALEDEQNAIEKAINNYAFTLSDNGFYNYAYTETFNDDTMRETGSAIITTDRSGLDFGPGELAAVNGVSGILTLNPELKIRYGITGSITDSNCYSLATSDTGLENAFDPNADVGWRLAISSPRPISSAVNGASKNGAQVVLDLYLTSAVPCDTILLTPFSDIPTEVLYISLYTSVDDSSELPVITEPLTIDRPLHISYSLQPVAKIRLILNQTVFTRTELPANKYEIIYRNFYQTIKDQTKDIQSVTFKAYNKNKKALKRIFLKTQSVLDSDYKFFKSAVPEIDFEVKYGPLTIDRIISGPSAYGNRSEMWNFQSDVNNYLRRMIHDSVFNSKQVALNDTNVFNVPSTFGRTFGGTLESGISQDSTTPKSLEPALSAQILGVPGLDQSVYLNYNYELGLRDLQVGSGDRVFRGVFISKPIPAETDSGEVKLKSDSVNFKLVGTSKDTGVVTSVEYCVSNQSTPRVETDWLPILPIDESEVTGERFFVNDGGVGYFRFPASNVGNTVLYKNGYIVDRNILETIEPVDGSSVLGFKVPVNIFLNTDIFTVDYTPVPGTQVVNFTNSGLGRAPLASAYDENGSGETFSSTGDNQTITLTYNPYINYDYVNDSAQSYSTTYGFIGPYQPITIVMADGTVALNQTNYRGTVQNNLAEFDSTKVAYLHSGKYITFNQPIDSSFTVYYQYIPSNLRVRTILRVNSTDFVSPVVNSFQIKTKTLKSDPRKSF